MDEVGKHVSAEYAPNVAYFLKQYSEQLGRQVVLITHNDHLAAVGDYSLRVSQNSKGISEVKAI
jgi:DNA repair ATPase RecN